MNDVSAKYEALIDKIAVFAHEREDIRAVLIQGSRARKDMPADDWSDLDVSIITTSAEYYISNETWLSQLGGYWLTFTEDTALGGNKERRVLFEDGLDVDFAITPYEMAHYIKTNGVPEDVKYSLGRGFRILIDKDGVLGDLHSMDMKPSPPELPSDREYLELVNDFIYHYVWALKKLNRKEIWAAISCSDGYLKARLLKLIEWHSRTVNGRDYDTWHAGRFVEKWADPRVAEGLKYSFGHFEQEDILRSIKETYKLFRILAIEVAQKLAYEYPIGNEQKVLQWSEENLEKHLKP